MAEWRVVDMVNEAAKKLGKDGRIFSNEEVRDWIEQQWKGTNATTINCTLLLCSVNVQSRIHYPENQKSRVKRHDDYDTLFRVGRAKYVLYNPETHGLWGILSVDGKLHVKQIKKPKDEMKNGDLDELTPGEEAQMLQGDIRSLQQQIGAFISEGGDPASDTIRDLKRETEWKRIHLEVVEGRRQSTLTPGEINLLKEMADAYIERLRELALLSDDEHQRVDGLLGLAEDEARAWSLAKRLWA